MDAHAAGKTYDCKQPGCTNEARSPVGRYSYCDAHQGQGKKAAAPRLTAVSGSVEQKIKSLAAQARADEAEREFQATMRDVLGEGDTGVRVVA